LHQFSKDYKFFAVTLPNWKINSFSPRKPFLSKKFILSIADRHHRIWNID